MSDFIVNDADDAAVKTLEDQQVVTLELRDQQVFVDSLLNPAPPNRKLKRAAGRYAPAKR